MKNCKVKGFTLLEVLVVMMLITLLSTLLFQGYAQVATIVNRLSERSNQGVKTTLQIHWYNKVLSHIINYQPSTKEKMQFDNRVIKAVTTESLLSVSGIPIVFELKLLDKNGHTFLIYSEEKEKPLVIGKWNTKQAGFVFSDNLKKWQTSWKKEKSSSKSKQLPKSIMIKIGEKEQKKTYFSTLTSFNYDGPTKYDP